MKTILDELNEIEACILARIQRMEAEHKEITATVGEVRRIAILKEVFRNNGKATPKEISDYAKKYGKPPARVLATIREKVRPCLPVTINGPDN